MRSFHPWCGGLVFVLLLLSCVVFPIPIVSAGTDADVEEESDFRAGSEPWMGVVDEVVSVPFEPSRAFLLIEQGLGEVRRYPAVVRKTGDESARFGGKEEVLVGAKVPLEKGDSDRTSFHVVFFLRDEEGSFAATPADRWTREMIRKNSRNLDELRDEAELLTRQVQVKEFELSQLEEKLRELRIRASSIAGIDEIVDLKIELERLKGIGQDARSEIARLRELISALRTTPDPPEINERRRDLLIQLTEAAQATAMADRLSRRRRDAAVATIQKKLSVIRAVKGLNANALAEEVIRLRGQRRALEAKLNLESNAPTNEF